jgi:hypothetical protein
MTINKNGGKKDDSNKVRFDLLIPEYLKGFAEVMTYGANKYGAYNYLHLERWQIEAAHDRHFNAYRSGERNDPETNKSHLFHVACNTMMLWAHDNWFFDQGSKIKQGDSNTTDYEQKDAAVKLFNYFIERGIQFWVSKQEKNNSIMISSGKEKMTIILYPESEAGLLGAIVIAVNDLPQQYAKTVDQAITILNKLPFNDPF